VNVKAQKAKEREEENLRVGEEKRGESEQEKRRKTLAMQVGEEREERKGQDFN